MLVGVCDREEGKEFEDNKTQDVIKNQITQGLNGIEGKDVERVVFAYEPIWAIGINSKENLTNVNIIKEIRRKKLILCKTRA